jgi:hypothetical protein
MARRFRSSSRPAVAPDPDARSVRWGWILWALCTLALAAALLLTPVERLPLLAVPGGILLLWPLWRGGRWLLAELAGAAHHEWQGRYYEFDGRQIRVLVDDDDELWMCAADVFDAVELKGGASDPQRARLLAGRDGLRHAPGTRLLCFTERGLAAWLERRTGARAVRFARWWRGEVVTPHYRRRELAGLSERAQGPHD